MGAPDPAPSAERRAGLIGWLREQFRVCRYDVCMSRAWNITHETCSCTECKALYFDGSLAGEGAGSSTLREAEAGSIPAPSQHSPDGTSDAG